MNGEHTEVKATSRAGDYGDSERKRVPRTELRVSGENSREKW